MYEMEPWWDASRQVGPWRPSFTFSFIIREREREREGIQVWAWCPEVFQCTEGASDNTSMCRSAEKHGVEHNVARWIHVMPSSWQIVTAKMGCMIRVSVMKESCFPVVELGGELVKHRISKVYSSFCLSQDSRQDLRILNRKDHIGLSSGLAAWVARGYPPCQYPTIDIYSQHSDCVVFRKTVMLLMKYMFNHSHEYIYLSICLTIEVHLTSETEISVSTK
jgi:hypothetical protein